MNMPVLETRKWREGIEWGKWKKTEGYCLYIPLPDLVCVVPCAYDMPSHPKRWSKIEWSFNSCPLINPGCLILIRRSWLHLSRPLPYTFLKPISLSFLCTPPYFLLTLPSPFIFYFRSFACIFIFFILILHLYFNYHMHI